MATYSRPELPPSLTGGGSLRPDYEQANHQELARIRALQTASAGFQALQTGLLNQLSGSLDSIHAEMSEVRAQQEDALAVQHELLQREQIQAELEEFIYQAEKLVSECSRPESDIPASSRYFLLTGVMQQVQNDGIGTPIIRGRDNKAAFENVVQQISELTKRLQDDPEVQEALAWAEQERQRQIEEQKRIRAERQRQRKERQEEISRLQRERERLVGRRKKLQIDEWYKDRFQWLLDSDYSKAAKMWIQVAIWVGTGGIVWIPVWFIATVESNEAALNIELDAQIAELDQKIHALEAQD